jgi:Ca2+-binding EF-hand superfamily protein
LPNILFNNHLDISHEEFQQILLTVDRNGDGKIEWTEFLEVMSDWLGEDLRPEQVKRRKLTAEQVSFFAISNSHNV